MKAYIITNKQTNQTVALKGNKELNKTLNCTRQYLDKVITKDGVNYQLTIKGEEWIISTLNLNRYYQLITTLKEYKPSFIRNAYTRQLNIIMLWDNTNGYYLSLTPESIYDINWYYCSSVKWAINKVKENIDYQISYAKEQRILTMLPNC